MGTSITLIADSVTVVITGDRPDVGPTYEKLDGWYGVPGVDLGFVKRPNAPGAFAPAQTFPDEAKVSIEGQHFAPSRTAGIEMRHDLAALYNDGRPVRAIVADDLMTTEREVMVESVEFPWTIHPDFQFTIDMRAADPRRYGAAIASSTGLATPGSGLDFPLELPSDETPNPDLGLDFGTVGVNGRLTVANPGTVATVSTFTVEGNMPDGFVIVNSTTGQRLTYLGPVAAGTVVELDSRTQTAFINGTAPAGRWLLSPEWWTVPPRSSIEVGFLALGPVAGSPRLTATTAPAFY